MLAQKPKCGPPLRASKTRLGLAPSRNSTIQRKKKKKEMSSPLYFPFFFFLISKIRSEKARGEKNTKPNE